MISEQIWQFPLNCRDFHFLKSSLSRVLFCDFSNFLFFQFCPKKILWFHLLCYIEPCDKFITGGDFSIQRERERGEKMTLRENETRSNEEFIWLERTTIFQQNTKWDNVQWTNLSVREGNNLSTSSDIKHFTHELFTLFANQFWHLIFHTRNV